MYRKRSIVIRHRWASRPSDQQAVGRLAATGWADSIIRAPVRVSTSVRGQAQPLAACGLSASARRAYGGRRARSVRVAPAHGDTIFKPWRGLAGAAQRSAGAAPQAGRTDVRLTSTEPDDLTGLLRPTMPCDTDALEIIILFQCGSGWVLKSSPVHHLPLHNALNHGMRGLRARWSGACGIFRVLARCEEPGRGPWVRYGIANAAERGGVV